jgi:hypothetical protein
VTVTIREAAVLLQATLDDLARYPELADYAAKANRVAVGFLTKLAQAAVALVDVVDEMDDSAT